MKTQKIRIKNNPNNKTFCNVGAYCCTEFNDSFFRSCSGILTEKKRSKMIASQVARLFSQSYTTIQRIDSKPLTRIINNGIQYRLPLSLQFPVDFLRFIKDWKAFHSQSAIRGTFRNPGHWLLVDLVKNCCMSWLLAAFGLVRLAKSKISTLPLRMRLISCKCLRKRRVESISKKKAGSGW